MVGDFLHRLVRELAEELVARSRQALQQHMLPGRVEQVPRDRLGEVAIGLLDQQAIAEIEHVAVEGELVAVARLVQQQRRLADQVEREVGETDVDLEHRPVPAPFAQALAEDQRVIAEAQEIVGAGIGCSLAEPRSGAVEERCAGLPSARRSAARTPSDVLHLVRDVVEGRVAVDLALRRLEQLARLVRVAATISADGTTHRLTPSSRRV